MLSRRPVISDLVHEFPQLAGSPAWASFFDRDAQWSEFVRLVWDLYRQDNSSRLRAAFHRLEQFLNEEDPQAEAWVAGFLQALQESASWHCESSEEVFVNCLGERTRYVWELLDAIRSDLARCSILEADILMWRVVHQWVPVQPHRHQAHPSASLRTLVMDRASGSFL